MGLLNKLLDDLEERQADLSGDRDKVLDGLSPVRDEDLRPSHRKRNVIVSLVAVCLVGILGYQFFELRRGTLPSVTSNTAEPAASQPGEPPSMDSAERIVFDAQVTEMDEARKGVPLEPVSTDSTDKRELTTNEQSERPEASEPEEILKVASGPSEPEPTEPEPSAPEKLVTSRSPEAAPPSEQSPGPQAREDEQSNEVENSQSSFSRVRVTAQSLYESGLKLNDEGNKAAAIEQMAQALERDPGHRDARDRLATYLVDRGRTRRAIEVLLTGLEIDPDQYDWAELAAHILVDTGELDAAVETLEKTRPAVSEDPDYYAFLAALLQKLGRYQESADQYRRVVQVRPNKGLWWMGLGISLERIEQFSDAREAYDKALEDNSLSTDLRRYINQRMTVVS
ncbi:MAG: tetratricopeptide repeat protein, partial [Pseudomonadales bacterium]